MIITRRRVLCGLIAAPAVVAYSNIMPVRAIPYASGGWIDGMIDGGMIDAAPSDVRFWDEQRFMECLWRLCREHPIASRFNVYPPSMWEVKG